MIAAQTHQFRPPGPVDGFFVVLFEFAEAVSPAVTLTVSPDPVLTATPLAALRTVSLPLVRSPLIELPSVVIVNAVSGSNWTLPALPKLMIASVPSGVDIVLDEKIVRP